MTSDSVRNELLSVLAELSRLFPNWRLGQTLANLAMAAGRPELSGVWDLEDTEALAAARRLIERNAARQTKAPNEPLQPTAAASPIQSR